MSATVRIPTILRTYTGGVGEVSADGSTLAEVLDSLEGNHPGIRARILDDAGALRRFVNVYVGDDDGAARLDPAEDVVELAGRLVTPAFVDAHLHAIQTGQMMTGLDLHEVTSRTELLDRVGLSDKAKNYPSQLSGGQQQRVAIARALAMEPKLMLFDEPTSALDPEMIKEVLDVMLGLAREGTTMLVVTHEMGFARSAAQRVAFMDEGRIVELSPPDKFFSAPETERARDFLSKILTQ